MQIKQKANAIGRNYDKKCDKKEQEHMLEEEKQIAIKREWRKSTIIKESACEINVAE